VVGTIVRARGEGATVIAFQTILDRMSAPTGKKSPAPEGAWPTDTFTTNDKNLFFNGEAISNPSSAGGAYGWRQPRFFFAAPMS